MAKDDPYYDRYKADMEADRRLMEQKHGYHAPLRSVNRGRPSDAELHRQAFARMAAEPQGNLNPRRNDQPVFTIDPIPSHEGGPS